MVNNNSDKLKSNYLNNDSSPCLKESRLSFKCLENNDYDHSKCEIFFANYRECKKFWGQIFIERKKNGITPHMPNSEERKKIFEERRNIGR